MSKVSPLCLARILSETNFLDIAQYAQIDGTCFNICIITGFRAFVVPKEAVAWLLQNKDGYSQ